MKGHQTKSQIVGPLYLPAIIGGYILAVEAYASAFIITGGQVDFGAWIHDANPFELAADYASGYESRVDENEFVRAFRRVVGYFTG